MTLDLIVLLKCSNPGVHYQAKNIFSDGIVPEIKANENLAEMHALP